MEEIKLTARYRDRKTWACTISWLAAPLITSAGILGVTPARADLFTPGVSQQIKLGDQVARQIEHQYRVLHDDRAARLERVGSSLLDHMGKDRGPWKWTYELIDSKEINAFALPGGHTFFFTGLFDQLTNDDELAAVMGHEMTHVRKQHWAHEYADQEKRELGLGLVLGLTHAGTGWGTLADVGDTLLTLKYSRSEEEQADQGGLQNMTAAGYNPNGMIELFKILKKAGGGGTPEFLSDHPLTDHRIKAAQDTIQKMGFEPEQ